MRQRLLLWATYGHYVAKRWDGGGRAASCVAAEAEDAPPLHHHCTTTHWITHWREWIPWRIRSLANTTHHSTVTTDQTLDAALGSGEPFPMRV
ncbi:hypothetical protein CMUS01_01317 [Colletotrichum musicola]|uniref:Uncharacterized protein n=1 Tax=Colletotrichum musicola TaxID=2175873 RepID=A0A8H6NX56_9PEZI|nr:hypothetical protein CMUS01_01317 [Colletotrichum musicola]